MSTSNENRVAVVLYGRQAREFLDLKAEIERRAGVEVTSRALVMGALKAMRRELIAAHDWQRPVS